MLISSSSRSGSSNSRDFKAFFEDKKVTLMCAVLTTKDLDAMVIGYKRFADYVIATQSKHPLSRKPSDIIKAFSDKDIKGKGYVIVEDAVKKALKHQKDNDSIIVVSGSLYIIAEVKKYFDKYAEN